MMLHWLYFAFAVSAEANLVTNSTVQFRLTSAENDTVASFLVPVVNGKLPEVRVEGDASVRFGKRMIAGGVEVIQVIVSRFIKETDITVNYSCPLDHIQPRNLMADYLFPWLPAAGNDEQMPGYLIIVPDEFYENILPLARWKERKGFKVWVKKTSETGTQREQIRSYIQNAYQTWEPAPTYVLLVGAINKIPAFPTPGATSCVTDHTYACVDGDDYLADLFVGRLPAANSSELDCIVAKIVGYESNPYCEDTLWFRRALMVGTSYQEGGTPAVTALVTKRVIRERLLNLGFDCVDTVFYPPTRYGRGPVDSAVNQGVTLINGRGWGQATGWIYPEFWREDVANLNNGWKLPVITSLYCGTGNYQANPCFGEVWLRAGTPTSPRGGVAFWGSSYTGTSTRWNNCMDYGIYNAILERGVVTLGPAMYAGKIEQLINFPLPEDSSDLKIYFHVYNLLGDPAMNIWLAVPRRISVSHPSIYPVGTALFSVEVRDSEGQPLKDAQVCLYKPGEVQAVRKTNSSGVAVFTITTTTPDSLYITVTGRDLKPYLAAIAGEYRGLLVGYQSHNPAMVAPGETSNLTVNLKNYGANQSAFNVTAVLSSLDSFGVVIDSVRNYGTLAPGEVRSAEPFPVYIAPSCTNGQRINLRLRILTADSSWTSDFNLAVSGPKFKILRSVIHDTNGFIDPGETSGVSFVIQNQGTISATGIIGILRSSNPFAVEILDSAAVFGNVAPQESIANGTDRFVVRAAPEIVNGRSFTLYLNLIGEGFQQLINFPLPIGKPSVSSPLGPDQGGYWGYDDLDTACPERPSFDWYEIDPNRGGQGARVLIGKDRAIPVNLPFRFRFYCHDYDIISISDNGYIAFGSTWWGEPYNWAIPSAQGPDGFVAVLWDDFLTDTLNAGGVFYYFDEPQHRFIVEWSNVYHVHGFRNPIIAEQQTFQVILYDPLFYPTSSSDGPIVCQYLDVRNDDSIPNNNHNFATVGIQSPDHRAGLSWTYGGYYPTPAAEICNHRAIKFTTNPPDTFTMIQEVTDKSQLAQIKIQPTIVRDGIWIEATNIGMRSIIELVDVAGNIVYTHHINANIERNRRFHMKLGQNPNLKLESGIYFIRWVSTEGKAFPLTTRIIYIK